MKINLNSKINISKKNKITILYSFASLVLLTGVLGVGVYLGYNNAPEVEKVFSISNKNTIVETDADFGAFWKAWNVLKDKSIYSKEVSDQERVWGAIQGLASSMGDPYTVFFNPEDNKMFTDEIKGSFSGIGAEIGIKDDILTVVAPLRNTPAWNAGIKAGDKIVKINEASTNDMTIDEAIGMIRGEAGTKVTFVIAREGESKTLDISVTRGKIDFPIIETELREDNIFVIKFYSFSENSSSLFKDAIKEFYESGSDKLVLDMRGNPGGYLESAISIGSWFVDKGEVLVKEDFGDKKEGDSYRSHGPRLFNDDLKFVVLVDGGSASASEILAGALKEYKIATIVGEKTFGKGSVQELVKITDDTSLKVTVAKWLTPSGLSISEKGLEPDVVVPMTIEDRKKDRDPQMDKAIEILLKAK